MMYVLYSPYLTFLIIFQVITSTIEVYKCENLTTNFFSKCGTLQIDMCRGVNINFAKKDYFHEENKDTGKNTCMIIW